MFRVRIAASILLLMVLAAQVLAADHKTLNLSGKRLDHEIAQILSDPEIARGFWGISAVSLDTGKPLYELNQDKLFTPASNTQQFNTAAVYCVIGP